MVKYLNFIIITLFIIIGCNKNLNYYSVLTDNDNSIIDNTSSIPSVNIPSPMNTKLDLIDDNFFVDNKNIFFNNSKLVVISGNGLNLRDKPLLESQIINTLPFGANVIIINKSEEISTVDNISSYWYQVQYSNDLGWVFGGYLTAISEKENLLYGDWQTDFDYFRFFPDGNFIGGRKYSGYREDGKWFLNEVNVLYLYGIGGWGDENNFEKDTYNTYKKNIYFYNDNSFSFFENANSIDIYIKKPLSYIETGLNPFE